MKSRLSPWALSTQQTPQPLSILFLSSLRGTCQDKYTGWIRDTLEPEKNIIVQYVDFTDWLSMPENITSYISTLVECKFTSLPSENQFWLLQSVMKGIVPVMVQFVWLYFYIAFFPLTIDLVNGLASVKRKVISHQLRWMEVYIMFPGCTELDVTPWGERRRWSSLLKRMLHSLARL